MIPRIHHISHIPPQIPQKKKPQKKEERLQKDRNTFKEMLERETGESSTFSAKV